MVFYSSERVGLFIDGASLFAATAALGFETDFKRLLDLIRKRAVLVRASYYVAHSEADDPGPLVAWLADNGYTTVVKAVRERAAGRGAGRIDVELAVDAMVLADSLDHIVIASGNGDLRSLVAALQDAGKRVSVLSTLATRPPVVADALRRQADQFIDLADVHSEIARTPAGDPGAPPSS